MSPKARRSASFHVSVYNHQQDVRLSLNQLQCLWQAAAVKLKQEKRALPPAIDVHLINVNTMIELHARHLKDPTPTDVITFLHGEIFICPAVAHKQAKEWQRTPKEEVALYGIHGLLHLAGWNDVTAQDAKAMAKRQEEILKQVLKRYPL